MVEHFIHYGPWNWIFLAIGLFMLGLLIPGVHLLWFRIAAVAVGTLALITGITWPVQVVAFCLFSVLSAFWVRRFSDPSKVLSDEPDLNARGHQYSGRAVQVVEEIVGGRGKVRAGDTVWSAEGPDAVLGETVIVIGARGTSLLITARERADQPSVQIASGLPQGR